MAKYQIRITSAAPNKVKLVKALRLVGKLSLRDAHMLMLYIKDQESCILIAGVEREIAEHVVGILGDCCLRVSIEPSSLEAPMILHPAAGIRYRWNWWFGPQQSESKSKTA
jgi:hypothetical protein